MNRPRLQEALARLKVGDFEALVSSRLDRLSRSVIDLAKMLQSAVKEDWNLIVLDIGLDLATPAGEMTATILASVARYEQRILGQRIKEALAQARENGTVLGRPPVELDAPLVEFVLGLQDEGCNRSEIARRLTEAGLKTPTGKQTWCATQVKRVLAREG